MKSYSITRKNLTVVGFVVLLVILLFFYLFVNVRAGEAYANCAAIKAATGRSNIPKGDPLYQKRMDWNKNGYSCE